MLPTLLPAQNAAYGRKSRAPLLLGRQQVSDAGLECKSLRPEAGVWILTAAEVQQRHHGDHSASQPSQDLRQLVKAELILTTHELQDKISRVGQSQKECLFETASLEQCCSISYNEY